MVGYNEGHLLKRCLSSANFCDQRLYVDLGSDDNSILIAKSLGWNTVLHPRVPIGEFIVSEMKHSMKYPWILFIDPDECISYSLGQAIEEIFSGKIPDTIGAFSAPWIFYFKNKKLEGTPWGGERTRPFIAHRDRFTLTTEVHRGRQLLESYEYQTVGNHDTDELIHHHWSESWNALIAKHLRYLRLEGESQFLSGRRTTVLKLLLSFPTVCLQALREKYPFRDGMRGIGLSLLWVVYKICAEWELLKFQRKARRGDCEQ